MEFPFYKKKPKAKVAFSICFAGSRYEDRVHAPWAGTVALLGSVPWTAPGTSASSHHGFELCLRASVLHSFCASVSKMYPKVSEKPKRAHMSVTLSKELDMSKCIWYYLVGVRGCWKIFLYRLMVIALPLCPMLAYRSFHRNAVLSDSGGNL